MQLQHHQRRSQTTSAVDGEFLYCDLSCVRWNDFPTGTLYAPKRIPLATGIYAPVEHVRSVETPTVDPSTYRANTAPDSASEF